MLEKSHCKVLDTQEIASIPLVKSIGSHFEIACKLLSQWSTDSESKELLEARISSIGYINAAIGFMPWFKNPPRAFGTMLALLLRLMLLELKMEHVDGGISMQKSLTTCFSTLVRNANRPQLLLAMHLLDQFLCDDVLLEQFDRKLTAIGALKCILVGVHGKQNKRILTK